MTDQTDTLINTFCFALALFYLLFQCLRLFYPKWALRFEGKYREVQERMRAAGVFLSEKELMRAVPVDAAVRGLLKGNITDEPGIICRSAFRRALAVTSFAVIFMLAMTFGYTDKPEAASYASDMVLVAIGLTLSAVARYRMLLVVTYIAERISEKTKA